MKQQEIYMDNAATSFPKAEGVSDAIKRYLDEFGCNIGRGSYERSTRVGMQVFETRERLAELFGCTDPKRVIFTAGATSALNQAILGFPQKDGTVLISSVEHNAVIRPLAGTNRGIRRIPSDADGRMRLDLLSVDWNTIDLCVCTHASNVSGTIQPVEELAKLCKDHGVPLVVDAAQTAGILPLDLEKDGYAAICLPAHKGLRGPQGLGVLILSETYAQQLQPILMGGTGSRSHCDRMPPFLPDKFEAGTLNLPGIFGLDAALKQVDIKRTRQREREQSERFLRGVETIQSIRIIGPKDPDKCVSVFSIDFPGKDNSIAADEIEQRFGIMTRCGLHCAPEAHKVLGTFPHGTVRFSFSEATTNEEIDCAVKAIAAVAEH